MADTTPPILHRLRGEWPCVPFGVRQPMAAFPAHWRVADTSADDCLDAAWPHGFCSNAHWALESRTSDQLTLVLDYPLTSPVQRLERRIALAADGFRIDLQLAIRVRRDCALPIGLHPVFALPSTTGQATLDAGTFISGRTYPLRFEPSSRLAVDAPFNDLRRVPLSAGGHDDLTRLPFAQNREELVQLHGCAGQVKLTDHAAGHILTLRWDPQDLPACVLWFSNRGRNEPPWNGRHLSLGVEPTAAFFDLNPSVLTSEHARASGLPELPRLSANTVWRTAYSLSLAPTLDP